MMGALIIQENECKHQFKLVFSIESLCFLNNGFLIKNINLDLQAEDIKLDDQIYEQISIWMFSVAYLFHPSDWICPVSACVPHKPKNDHLVFLWVHVLNWPARSIDKLWAVRTEDNGSGYFISVCRIFIAM